MANFDVPTAVPGIMGGLQSALGGIEAAREREMAARQQQEMQARLTQGAELLQSGDPNAVARWTLQNPDLSKQFLQAADIQDNLTQKPRIQVAKDVLSGRLNPRSAYEERAMEIEAQGGSSAQLRGALEEMSDDELREMAKMDLALMAPKAFESYQNATKDDISMGSKTANIQDFEYYENLLSQGKDRQAKMFAKDVGLIPKDKPLSATAEKSLIDSQQAFFDSTTQSREYELLANDFDRFRGGLPAGTRATIGEFIKSATGSQDEATELRRRFNKVRLSEALKYLPPGPATDKDVQEAFKGVPKENANPDQVKSFLQGAAKMSAIDAEFQEFRANYISENDNTKGLIAAWKKAIENGEVESLSLLQEEASPVFQGADQQAYDWAISNPQDPRSAQILQRLGVR